MRLGPRRFLGRQAILDRDEKLFGQELRFRDGLESYFSSTDVESACLSTLDSSLLMGLDLLCGGAYACVNCTRDVLLGEYLTLLPSHATIVEVLETVTPHREVYAACLRLKEAGYRLALDDFAPADAREPLTVLADIIKVDALATSRQQWRPMVERYASRNIRMLAEKVETRPDFVLARDLGFTYFQGYFFQKPVVLGRPSRLGPLYEIVLSQESGDWERRSRLAAELHLKESDVAKAYRLSVRWAREVMAI